MKVLTTLYDDAVDESAGTDAASTVANLKVSEEERQALQEATHGDLSSLAIRYSHAVALGESGADAGLLRYAEEQGKQILDLRTPDNLNECYAKIYEEPVAKKV